MKTKLFSIFILSVLCNMFSPAQSQVKIDVKGKIIDKTNDRANDRTDDAIDGGLDKMEEGIKNVFRENKKDKDDEEIDEEETETGKKTSKEDKTDDKQNLTWAKYDFVPGDKIIFEDNQENEQNGEFPSRWDLQGGNIENASLGMDNVIYFKDESSCIVPFITNPDKDYLPDIFTIEFDAWFEIDEYCHYLISFYDEKNQSELDLSPLIIKANHAYIYQVSEGFYPGEDEEDKIAKSFWRHIALSFNTRALKVYIDDARILNIPNLGVNPTGLTICCDGMNVVGAKGTNRLIKNIRIAQGGVKLYDKLLQDGKIITNGIKFDVNKATIKPESMGVINSIVQLMKEHPDLKFSVEGHTDSDGTDAANQTLSEQRAEAVKNKLSQMGIDSGRLSYKGWGETKPIDSNNTPEGKANNRRVEFVKI